MNRSMAYVGLAGLGVALGAAAAFNAMQSVRSVVVIGIFAGDFWAGAAVTAAVASRRQARRPRQFV